MILLVGVSFGMYMKVGSLDKVQAWKDTVARLPELSQRLMDEANPLSDQEMDDLTLALRTRLHENAERCHWLAFAGPYRYG